MTETTAKPNGRQRDRRKTLGQERAIKKHEQRKLNYARNYEKAFAQKIINNAKSHLDKLRRAE
jgi:hypothetical protein